jgi:hypothetical protein
MSKSTNKKAGSKKHGRNKRVVDQSTSAYVRGKITFDAYAKQIRVKR